MLIISLDDDLIGATRRLRRGLRDIRDRAARHDHRWQLVAIAGLLDGDRAMVLVQHIGIDRAEVRTVFGRRWPEIAITNPGDIHPSSAMIVDNAADLARRRRGIEPIRVVILPQIAATRDPSHDQPMPIAV